jgi:restriction endonuclease hincII family protein
MNPIVVREYEKIGIKGTSKSDIDKIIDKDKFDKLKEFIKDSKLHEEPKFFEVYKDHIIPQNFIGSINIDDISIEIFPKIPLVKDDKAQERKRFLEILEYVETFNENIFENLEIGNQDMPILEIFISNFIKEVEKIVKKGLVYSYINKSENILYFKGKLDLPNHIKYNIIENKFFMNFDEFSINSMENCLLKLALEKIKNISSNMENIDKLHQLLIQFEDIETSGLNPVHLFKKILYNKKNEFYKKSLNLAKFFLLDESPYSIFFNDKKEVTGVFFPMETIYESYVANKLKQLINEKYSDKFSIKIQDSSHFIFKNCSFNKKQIKENIKFFNIRPDIVLRNKKNNNEVIILDTKWKILRYEKENFNILKDDFIQLIKYIVSYSSKENPCCRAYFVHPATNTTKNENSFSFIDKILFENDSLKIGAYFIDLSSEDEVDKSLKNILKDI